MTVAFISLMTIFPWGGSEDLWYKTAKVALKQGYAVSTLTKRWDTVPARIAELRQLGAITTFYTTQPTSLSGRIAYYLGATSSLSVPVAPADVYVISNGSTWDFIRFRSIAEKFINLGKPYVLISQHSFESGDVVAESDRAYALDVIGRAAAVFFVARRNLEAAERQVAGVIGQATIISNPLNTKEKAIKPYPSSATLLLACVARLECQVKGQDVLLQALSGPQWANRDFRLRFYGTGPSQDHLQALITLYGLQNKVTLEGHIADVDRIWEENQVLVLPSFSEGTSLALLEAMMAGRTALATDVGDTGLYVLPGRTGILLATASVKCLRAGLEDLWQARANLEAIGQQAFAHAVAITDFYPEKTLLKAIEAVLQPAQE